MTLPASPVPDAPEAPDARLESPRARPERCAPSSVSRGDALPGTAAPVTRWFLLEQPGPWGHDALRDSRLPREVADAVAAAAARTGTRVLVVRQPGRQVERPQRRWALVDSRPNHEQVRWGLADNPAELAAGVDGVGAGPPTPGPLYLVCAHSRHDACCAIRGRPVAHALAASRPGQVWECSHVGGDRFAANVVVLPQGLYYGHVPAGAAVALAETHERGLVVPALLRGRSAFSPAVQAAQAHARKRTGDARITALSPRSATQVGPSRWSVRLAGDDEDLVLVVHRVSAGAPGRLTCASTRLERAPAWELESFATAEAATGG